MSIRLRGGLARGRLRYVFRGQSVVVLGSLRPSAPGQHAVVELLRGHRVVSRREVAITPAPGGVGNFTARMPVRRRGAFRLRALQGALKSPDLPLQAVFWSARAAERGTKVLLLQRGLRSLGFAVPRSGRFGAATSRAVLAFRKTNSMRRRRAASPALYARIFRHHGRFTLRHPRAGRHLEFDRSRRVLVLAAGGRAWRVYDASSRKPALGTYHFSRKQAGSTVYFHGGLSIHAQRGLRTGGIRVAVPDARRISQWITRGMQIFVYR